MIYWPLSKRKLASFLSEIYLWISVDSRNTHPVTGLRVEEIGNGHSKPLHVHAKIPVNAPAVGFERT